MCPWLLLAAGTWNNHNRLQRSWQGEFYLFAHVCWQCHYVRHLAERIATTSSSHGRPRRAPRSAERDLSAPARSAAPNLEKATLKLQDFTYPADSQWAPVSMQDGRASDPGQWQVNITEYPDGVRACAFRTPAKVALFREGDESWRFRPRSPRTREVRSDFQKSEESLSRSRRSIVHRARCLQATYLWTFGRRGLFGSTAELWGVWGRFRELYKRRFRRQLEYVAVPEFDNGGWHLHVAIGTWMDVISLRILWYRALGGTGRETGSDTPGSVNAKFFRGSKRCGRIARYISSYCGKGFERGGMNKRLYAASVGLRPCASASWRVLDDPCRYELSCTVSEWLRAMRGKGFARAFYGDHSGLEYFVLQL